MGDTGGKRPQPLRTSSGRKLGLLKHQLHLVKRKSPRGTERYEVEQVDETLSFDKGFFLFIRAIQLLTQVALGPDLGSSQRQARKKI